MSLLFFRVRFKLYLKDNIILFKLISTYSLCFSYLDPFDFLTRFSNYLFRIMYSTTEIFTNVFPTLHVYLMITKSLWHSKVVSLAVSMIIKTSFFFHLQLSGIAHTGPFETKKPSYCNKTEAHNIDHREILSINLIETILDFICVSLFCIVCY